MSPVSGAARAPTLLVFEKPLGKRISRGGAALGTVTLTAAAWRSPRVSRIVVLCILGFAVLCFALGQGVGVRASPSFGVGST